MALLQNNGLDEYFFNKFQLNMTTQEIQPEDEHSQSIVDREDEELLDESAQKMRPPLATKVLKSSKVTTKQLKSNNAHVCNICQKTFKASQRLRYHIRQKYFNLKAKTLIYEMKKINQVWVEKVLNSDKLIEITRTGQNTLLMKKSEPNAVVESDQSIQELDLSYLYPTNSNYKFKECTVCEVKVPRQTYKKHLVSHMI